MLLITNKLNLYILELKSESESDVAVMSDSLRPHGL